MIGSKSIAENTKGTTKPWHGVFFNGIYAGRMQRLTVFVINASWKGSKRKKNAVFVLYMLQFEFAFLKIENYSFHTAWGKTAKFES